MIADHPLARLAALPGTAPAHALPVHLPCVVKMIVKSVAVPALGLGGRVPGLVSCALAPRTIRSRVDESALTVTRHAPPLPVCGLNAPGHTLLNATGTVGCARARALGATICRCNDCAHVRLAVVRPGVTTHGHTSPVTGHMNVAGLVTALPLTARGLGRGVGGLDGVAGIMRRLLLFPAIAATLGRRWSPPLRLRVAPSLFPRPLSRTLSGCSLACLGPWRSGMRL